MNNHVKVPAKLSLAVIAACLVSFCGLITETAVNIVFPAVMNTFDVSTKTVQWLTTGNLLVVAMITPLSAFLQCKPDAGLALYFCNSDSCFNFYIHSRNCYH